MEMLACFGRKQMSRNFSDSAFSLGGTIRKNWITKNLEKDRRTQGL